MGRHLELSVARRGRGRGAPRPGVRSPSANALANEVTRLGELGFAAAATDTAGALRSWNNAAEALLGLDRRRLLGRSIATIPLGPESQQVAVTMIEQLWKSGAANGELDVETVLGTLAHLDVRGRAVRDEAGALQGYLVVALDITRLARAERLARRSEHELQLALKIPDWGSWEWDVEEELLTPSGRFTSWLGLEPGQRLSMGDALAVMPADDRIRVEGELDRLVAGAVQQYSISYRLRGRGGELRWFEAYCEALRRADGKVSHVRGITVDVTARVAAQHSAFLQASLLDEIDASVVTTDLQGEVLSWNKGAELLYGWTRTEAIGSNVRDLIVSDEAEPWEATETALETEGRWDGECLKRRKDGSTFPAYVRHRSIRDESGRRIGIVAVSMDVSQRKDSERELRTARTYLRAVTDSMGQGVYTADNDGRVNYMNPVALELLGWSLPELEGQPAHEVVHRHRADGSPYPIEECPIMTALKRGEPVSVPDDVFICRDGRALPVAYTAAPIATLDGTQGCVIVFEDITERKAETERLERQLEKLSWVGQIREALADGRFELYAQPIVEIASGCVVQRELLLRMRAAGERGAEEKLHAPSEFLPVAEEFGLVGDIDRWVIDRATELARTGIAVELNMSACSICDPSVLGHIRRALDRTGTDPRMMVFELTETAILSDIGAAHEFIDELHAMQCKVALDDFGTGYGGFTYLKKLPIDYLKIDMEFVSDLRCNAASRNVVEAIVNLARGFDLITVAEGVEDRETLEFLRDLGVDRAQGYYLGRPAPPEPDQSEVSGSQTTPEAGASDAVPPAVGR
jgi:PAS domain S-box-containing protein